MMGVPSEDLDHHIELIRDLSAPGGPLAPDAPMATIYNPDWFDQNLFAQGVQNPLPDRARLQAQPINDVRLSGDFRADHQALVLAGPARGR